MTGSVAGGWWAMECGQRVQDFLAMEPGLEMERRNVEEYLRFGA